MAAWIPIFATGVHHGEAFTDDHLDQIVLNFKGKTKDVPLVVGHESEEFQAKLQEQTGIPSFGVVKALKAEAGKLFAKFDGVHDQVKEWIANNFFTQRSVELGEGQNGLFLFRVALLGAAPPEVPGLPPLLSTDMADSPQTLKIVNSKNKDAKAMPPQIPASMPAAMQDEAPTGEEVSPTLDERVASLEAAVAQILEIVQAEEAPAEEAPVAAAASVETDELKALRTELKASQDRIAKIEAGRLTEATAVTAKENVEFIDQMCAEGRLSPAVKDDALATLNGAHNGTRGSFMKTFAAMPKNKMFAELAVSGGSADTAEEQIAAGVDEDLADPAFRKMCSLSRDELIEVRSSDLKK